MSPYRSSSPRLMGVPVTALLVFLARPVARSAQPKHACIEREASTEGKDPEYTRQPPATYDKVVRCPPGVRP